MREIIEKLVKHNPFNMKSLYDSFWPGFSTDIAISDDLNILENEFSTNECQKVAYGILRHAFLIELVKVPKIETTKFRTRWDSQLMSDPRECSFEECLEIAQHLVRSLTDGWLNKPENIEALSLFFNHSILPYELPIDYIERSTNNDSVNTKIHRKGNLTWIVNGDVIRTLKLRQYLTDPETSPDKDFFKKVIKDKIKTKTYLTDRVQTGAYKTNREKRWEVHPHSVHFALRRECMAIEYELITQLCGFQGFPEDFRLLLQDQGILPQEMAISCCPITLEPLSFQGFREELMHPTHGKSNFQVGHLDPLKLDEPGRFNTGHTSKNIAWISSDGNRIQGSMSPDCLTHLILQWQ